METSQERLLSKKIDNLYEAAYYTLFGAWITGAYIRRVPLNRVDKVGYRDQWIVLMEGIPESQYIIWREGYPLANVKDLMNARKKVKRSVKQCIYQR